jgi:hypothetical protein
MKKSHLLDALCAVSMTRETPILSRSSIGGAGRGVRRRVGVASGLAPGNPVSVFGSWLRPLRSGVLQFIWVLAIAVAFAAASGRDVAAQNTGCDVDGSIATCPDVPVDGISYTSVVNTVNVGDGVEGETVVNPGTIGINLFRFGSDGTSDIDVDFATILWDTDEDPDTDDVSVVSADGTSPLLIPAFSRSITMSMLMVRILAQGHHSPLPMPAASSWSRVGDRAALVAAGLFFLSIHIAVTARAVEAPARSLSTAIPALP